MRNIILTASALMLAAASGWADDDARPDDIDPTLEPEECLSLGAIRRTEIADDQNILFYASGGKIYRNYLPRKCRGLRRADSFMYKTSLSRLCNVDTITVLDDLGFGFNQGRTCGLGKFYPISEEEADILLDKEKAPPKPPEEPEEP